MRDRKTVSFALTASGPASRVRALLERVRPHVDEIVLAVDGGGDTGALEACGDLADRRLTFELRDSPARLIGWIHHQCAGDWILRVDDDEMPSDALLAALPELAADPHPLAYHLRRLWVHPTADRRLASRPWSVDYQAARLVRNLPGAWTFDGAVHTVGDVEGEQRFVDAPLYHCDLILTPPELRRAKRVRYESEWPGVELGGMGTNDLYLPEDAGGLEWATIPVADAAAVQSLLEGSATASASAAGAPIGHASFAEIDRFNLRRAPADGDFDASVAIEDAPERVAAAGIRHLFVAATNTGAEPWLWAPRSGPLPGSARTTPPGWAPVRVEYRWRDPAGDRRPYRGWEPLSEAVWPGETSRVPVDVRTPAEAGEWELEVGMERGGRDFGRAAYRVVVEVAPPSSSRSAVAAELAAVRHRIDHEYARAREAEEATDELVGLRRHRLGAWLMRNGRGDGGSR